MKKRNGKSITSHRNIVMERHFLISQIFKRIQKSLTKIDSPKGEKESKKENIFTFHVSSKCRHSV